MDLSNLGKIELGDLSPAAVAAKQTAAKAWSSALTSLATAGIAWGMAYVSGSQDPSVIGAVTEAVNNLFLLTVTTAVPAILSYYVTYAIPNRPKE
jgi:hypothetical protein